MPIKQDSLANSTTDLILLALSLGARSVRTWTSTEEALTRDLPASHRFVPPTIRQAIQDGDDPLGEAYCRLFSLDERRPTGATYTPRSIVDAMLFWASTEVSPVRVVDPGAGSARFLVAAGLRFPQAQLIAIEIDPLASVLARGHLAAAGMADRSQVILGDFREIELPQIAGPTLFIGNPPYVRHHLIERRWKAWLTTTARQHGIRASQLAGLHAHFFLATAEHSRPGDVGVLITAAEWLDVNYGRLVRELLIGTLGCKTIHVIEPTADPFPGTQSTAVITGFAVGSIPERVGLRRVATLEELGTLQTDWFVKRERLVGADRWTLLTRVNQELREGFVELGELCRVHRGQATGANEVWIAGEHSVGLPVSVLYPSVTKARELFAAEGALTDASSLRRVIDLPVDLDEFDKSERTYISQFLRFAKSHGVQRGFYAQNRKAWWSVGLRDPAPILATYMARRPPAFVQNVAGARHINIAHGLYPREALDSLQLSRLATYLSSNVSTTDGRTYAGGLTKFEPREMERLLVPRPELLEGDWLTRTISIV